MVDVRSVRCLITLRRPSLLMIPSESMWEIKIPQSLFPEGCVPLGSSPPMIRMPNFSNSFFRIVISSKPSGGGSWRTVRIICASLSERNATACWCVASETSRPLIFKSRSPTLKRLVRSAAPSAMMLEIKIPRSFPPNGTHDVPLPPTIRRPILSSIFFSKTSFKNNDFHS